MKETNKNGITNTRLLVAQLTVNEVELWGIGSSTRHVRTCFISLPKNVASLRFFLYMEDLLYGSKRKTRTSDSDNEAKSPEGKKICNENTTADDIREVAITADNGEEVQALGATSTMEDNTEQLKLILSKLESLETKLETAIETVIQLKTTVNKLESTVEKVQEDAKQLKENVVMMDKGVSFLNSDFKLRN